MLPIKSTQFPESDADFMQLTVVGPAGSHYSFFEKYEEQLESTLSAYPELKNYTYTTNGNRVSVALELLLSAERSSLGLRDSFELTDILMEDLMFLRQNGMKLDLVAQS
jgi:multidrug efflux pump subunit AcrB